MNSGFHRKTNLHNFCYIIPNSIFETSIEISEDKEQNLKFSIPCEQNAMSYIHSKFCSKPSHPKLHTHTLFRKSFSHTSVFPPEPRFFLPNLGFNYSGGGTHQPMLFTLCPTKNPIPFLIHSRTTQIP